jgi:hypothetical protein
VAVSLWVHEMPSYRCYFKNTDGRIQSVENFEADGVDAAIDRALSMLVAQPHHHSFDLWQGAHRLYVSSDDLPRHQCCVYEGAIAMTLMTIATIIGEKLKQKISCFYLNSPQMITSLKFCLPAVGVNVDAEIDRGALLLSSDQEHTADGRFDVDRMLLSLEDKTEEALKDGYKALWASGDMAWELGPHCSVRKLLEYEWKLEQLLRRQPALSGICQYDATTLPRDLVRHGVAAHRSIFVDETRSQVNLHYLAPSDSDIILHPEIDGIIDRLCRTYPD